MVTATRPTVVTLPTAIREATWKALGIAPTEAQKLILNDPHQTKLVAGGFRGGKSLLAAIAGVEMTLAFISEYREKAGGHVAWLVGSDYERTRGEFNNPEGSLTSFFQKLGLLRRASKRIDPGSIEIATPSGVPFTIKTKSASDPTSLGMEGPIWIIGCEAAQFDLDTYYRMASRVSEARARFPGYGMLLLEGTFEKQGGLMSWYATLWKKWQNADIQKRENAASFSLPSHSNTFLYPGGMNDPEIQRLKAELPEEVFKERHLGEPVDPAHRVFPMFDMTVHIKDCKYDPDKEVLLAIDPGYSGRSSTYTVLVFQEHEIGEVKQRQFQCIDEIAINKTLPTWAHFTVSDICKLAKNRYWWKNPHKRGVIDIAGTAHAGAQESNEEVWMKETGLILAHQKVNILPGIDRMKESLNVLHFTNEPSIVFDPSCKLVLSEFGAWPNPFDHLPHVYSYPQNAQGDIIASKPRDEYCDGIKAATYLLVNELGYSDARDRKPVAHVRRWRER